MFPDPLRVALTVGPAGYGGTATYARELARALIRRCDVELVTVGTDAARAELGVEPDRHLALAGGRLRGQAQVVALRRRLADARIEVFHGTRQLLPFRASVPTVLTFHDDFAITRRGDYDLLKRLLLPPAQRRSLRLADAVIALAPDTAAIARRYVRRGVEVFTTGAAAPTTLTDAVAVPPAAALPARYALVVGDCSPRKNVAALLDQWDAARTATGLDLVVAGGRGASPELRARLGREPHVVFVAEPSWAELAHLYAAAAVVVEPSFAEGFGFAHVEAAHFGRPYVPLREQADVARAVVTALASSERCRRAEVTVDGGWDVVADRVLAVYRAVTGRC